MRGLTSIRERLAKLASSMPDAASEPGKTSEQMIREVAQIVADDEEREAALAALPAEEQPAARAEARLEFLWELEGGTAKDRDEWARMHAEAVRVLTDPAYTGMVPILRRFVEGIASIPPAAAEERSTLAHRAV